LLGLPKHSGIKKSAGSSSVLLTSPITFTEFSGPDLINIVKKRKTALKWLNNDPNIASYQVFRSSNPSALPEKPLEAKVPKDLKKRWTLLTLVRNKAGISELKFTDRKPPLKSKALYYLVLGRNKNGKIIAASPVAKSWLKIIEPKTAREYSAEEMDALFNKFSNMGPDIVYEPEALQSTLHSHKPIILPQKEPRKECRFAIVNCLNYAEADDRCGKSAGACMSCENCNMFIRQEQCDSLGLKDGYLLPKSFDPVEFAPSKLTPILASHLCTIKHELTHAFQDCSLSSCEMEVGAYTSGADCLKGFEKQLKGDKWFSAWICQNESQIAQQLCQSSNQNCQCENEMAGAPGNCQVRCFDAYTSCLRRYHSDDEVFDLATRNNFCKGAGNCMYCPEPKPLFCGPTPTPLPTFSPTNTPTPTATPSNTPTSTPVGLAYCGLKEQEVGAIISGLAKKSAKNALGWYLNNTVGYTFPLEEDKYDRMLCTESAVNSSNKYFYYSSVDYSLGDGAYDLQFIRKDYFSSIGVWNVFYSSDAEVGFQEFRAAYSNTTSSTKPMSIKQLGDFGYSELQLFISCTSPTFGIYETTAELILRPPGYCPGCGVARWVDKVTHPSNVAPTFNLKKPDNVTFKNDFGYFGAQFERGPNCAQPEPSDTPVAYPSASLRF